MAGEFLAGVKIELDYSSVDAFVASVKSAVDKLNALRDEGSKGGTSTAGDAALLEGATSRARARGANGRFLSSSNDPAAKAQNDLIAAVKENTKAHAKTQQVLATGGAGGGGGRGRRRAAAAAGDARDGDDGPFSGLNDRLAAYQSLNVGASERLTRDSRYNPYGAINRRLSGYNSFGSSNALSLRDFQRQRTEAYRGASSLGSGINSDLGSVLGGSNGLANDAATLASRLEAANASLQAFSDKLDHTLDISSVARENVGRQNYNRQVEAEMANIRRSNGQGLGFGAGGTFYQQFQGATHNNDHNVAAGRQNTDYQTFGQTITSHAARAASYIGPGLVIGGGIEELRMSVEEAEQAQMALREVQAEFSALGQGSQFAGFSNSIKDISNQTGLATSEVAELGLAMKGVFGSTQQATIALEGVAKGAIAMGLDVQEAQQDITAITQSFNTLQQEGGASITTVTNEMLHLQDLTGVSSAQILAGTADAASSANDVGLNSKQTASYIAAGAQRSGLSAETIGQTFSKLLDGLTQQSGQIYSAFQASPQTAALLPKMTGSLGQQLPALLQGLGELPIAQRVQVEQSLGINSSAQPSLNAIIAGSSKAQQLASTNAPANRTQEEFALQEKTVEQSLERLRQEFVNFGVTLIDSGLGTVLIAVADGTGKLVSAMDDLGKVTGGLPQEIAAVVVGLYTVKAGLAALKTSEAATAAGSSLPLVGRLFSGGAAAEEGAAAEGGAAAAETGGGILSASAIGGPIGLAIGAALVAAVSASKTSWGKSLLHDISGGAQDLYHDVAGGTTPAQDRAAYGAKLPKSIKPIDLRVGGSTYYNANQLPGWINPITQATEAQTKMLNYQTTDWTGVQSAYAAGTDSVKNLEAAAKNTLAAAQKAYLSSPSRQNYENVAAAQEAQNQLLDQWVTQSQQIQQSIEQTGNVQVDVGNISSLVGDLGKEKTPAAKLQTVNAIIAAAQQQVQDEAAEATSIAEKNKILSQGLKLTATQESAINAALAVNKLAPIGSTIGGQATTQSAAYQSAQEGLAATQAVSAANADEDPQKILQSQIAEYQSEAAAYLSTGGKASDPAYKTLEAQIKTTNQQIVDGTSAIMQANAGLLQATLANDPVAAAQAGVQQAQAALADAHGAAAQKQAAAQVATANLQVQQAIIAQNDAVSSIAQASLTAQGNPIGAAFTQYQQALQDVATRMAQDKQDGVNTSQDTTLQNMIATQIGDQTQYLQTQFSTIQQTTQEQIYLGQITANQAIAQLEAGMQQAQGNQQLVLQYQQAIRQIQNSAGSNLNFDIPSNLLVNPTLYQAARVNAGAGAAYNDNRQVQVTINVQNSSQTSGAVQQLLNAVGGSATGGSTTGPLVGATTS